MKVKLLLIYIDQNDQWEDIPLYEAIVRRLRQLNVAGATVNNGIMGFGSHFNMHRKRLFGSYDDRPVTIHVADTEQKIAGILPVIRSMVTEGLILTIDADQAFPVGQPPQEGDSIPR